MLGREVLDRLADRHTGRSVDPRREPVVHGAGVPLADVSQHPADRLADEELPLIEHRVGIAGKAIEARAVLQRRKLRQQRRAPDPEVRVRGPRIELVCRRRGAGARASRARCRRAGRRAPTCVSPDQLFQQAQVIWAEQRRIRLEQQRGREPAFEDRSRPERPDECDELVMAQVTMLASERPDDGAAVRSPGSEVLELATSGSASRRRHVPGYRRHAAASATDPRPAERREPSSERVYVRGGH